MQLFLKTLIIHCLITGRPIQAKAVGDEEDDDLIDSPQPTSDKALQDYVEETTQAHSEEDEDVDVPAENTKVEVRMRKKMFHDHFNDFLKLIADDSMEDINQLIYAYRDYYTFLNSWEFVKARKFGEILKNLKKVKEFQALVQFLENDDIDIFYYSDKFDDFVETLEGQTGVQKTKGSDFNAFLRDVMDVIPFRKLSRLFEKKMTADENFRNVFMDIYSDEFDELVQQLKRTDAYKAEVAKLNANGIDIQHVYMLIKSLFGLH